MALLRSRIQRRNKDDAEVEGSGAWGRLCGTCIQTYGTFLVGGGSVG